MDTASINLIRQVHPKWVPIALAAYLRAVDATPAGVHPVVECVGRSFEESQHDYDLGRTIKNPDGVDAEHPMGAIISYARPGHSWHNWFLALDFHLLINGKPYWPATAEEAMANKNWMIVVNIFKAVGFNWGGEFPDKFKDPPHLEHKMGQTIDALLAKRAARDFIPGTHFINF